MKKIHQIILALISMAVITSLLFLFNINDDYHYLVAQLLLVQIVIGFLLYRRYVMPVTILISIAHILHDGITLMEFPLNAVTESIIQIAVLILLINLLNSSEKIKNSLNNIIEASRVGTWQWNIVSREIFINDMWAEMLGYRKEDLNPINIDTWKKLTLPEDLNKSMEQLNRVFNKEKEYYDCEIRMKHKDGHYIWVHDRGKVTTWDKSGQAIIMSGTHTDITKTKHTEQKLLYFHDMMSYVIDHMNSGIAVHDRNMNYVYVSKKYMDQYHIKGDIIGKNHYDVFPDLPDKWKKVHQRCLKGEIIKADRDPYPHEDGRVDMTRWECRPWYDEFGEIAGIIVYTEVITEFIKIEEDLKKSKEMLQLVMDTMPIGIAVNSVEPDVKFSYMNDEFPKAYNTTKEALENGDFWEVVYEDEHFREQIKQIVLSGVETGDPSQMTWIDVPIKKAGKIVKYVTAMNKMLPDDSGVISIAIDTTHRKTLEKSLMDKASELFIQKETIEATLLSIDDVVISTDKDGFITSFNDKAVVLTGYTKEEVIGKKFGEIFKIIDERTNEVLTCPAQEVIRTGKTISLVNHSVMYFKDKQKHYVEYNSAPIRDLKNQLIGAILIIRDVTESKQKQREIEFLSTHDYLTGLYNRRFFTETLNDFDKKALYPLGVMMIDVNGLKIINDAYGHDVGDTVLINIAKAIEEVSKDRGIASRIGGDEFTVILNNTTKEEIQELRDKMNNRINNVSVKNVSLSVSIGYALKEKPGTDINEIIKDAENVMYKYKLTDGASARNHTIQAIYKTLTDKFVLERIHSERVADLSMRMGEALGMDPDDVKELRMSGLFHDIGKISIPDSVLYKPDRLTEDEFEIIKEHPRNGYMILRAADEYSDLAANALLHHERWDGSGYPEGLQGEAIPLQARIICIADAFEAMTSDRPYRKGMSFTKAIKELKANSGTQFDPNLVNIFIEKVVNNKDTSPA
jgi:diguanylate cyclase (GGDEF)-like protein/PAS domain S-box-containing protein